MNELLKKILGVASYCIIHHLIVLFTFSFLEVSSDSNELIRVFYPAAGLNLAIIIGYGIYAIPVVILAIFFSMVLRSRPPEVIIAALTSYTIVYLAILFLIVRIIRFEGKINSLKDFKKFLVLAFVSPLITGATLVFFYTLIDIFTKEDYWHLVFDFWIGDLVGIIIITPILNSKFFPLNHGIHIQNYLNITDFLDLAKIGTLLVVIVLTFIIVETGLTISVVILVYFPYAYTIYKTNFQSTLLLNSIFNFLLVIFLSIFGENQINILLLQINMLTITLPILFISILLEDQKTFHGEILDLQKQIIITKLLLKSEIELTKRNFTEANFLLNEAEKIMSQGKLDLNEEDLKEQKNKMIEELRMWQSIVYGPNQPFPELEEEELKEYLNSASNLVKRLQDEM